MYMYIYIHIHTHTHTYIYNIYHVMLYANKYISEKEKSFNGLCFQLDLINIHVFRFFCPECDTCRQGNWTSNLIILLSYFMYSHHHNTHSWLTLPWLWVSQHHSLTSLLLCIYLTLSLMLLSSPFLLDSNPFVSSPESSFLIILCELDTSLQA